MDAEYEQNKVILLHWLALFGCIVGNEETLLTCYNYGTSSRGGKSLRNGNLIMTPLKSKSPYAKKLNKIIAKRIREEYIPKNKIYGAKALGEKYGVSSKTIMSIVEGYCWKEEKSK